MQASLSSSAYGMLSCCVHHRRFAPSVPVLLPPSTVSSGPVPKRNNGQCLRRSSTTCPSRAQQQTGCVYLLPFGHLRGRRGLWFVVHGCVAGVPAAVSFFAALSLCASLAHSSLPRSLRSVCRKLSQWKSTRTQLLSSLTFDVDNQKISG